MRQSNDPLFANPCIECIENRPAAQLIIRLRFRPEAPAPGRLFASSRLRILGARRHTQPPRRIPVLSRKPAKRKKTKATGRSRAQAAAGQKNNRTAALIWAAVIVFAIASGAHYLSGSTENRARSVPSLGNRHIRVGTSGAINYNTDPPTSGPHYPTIVHWGVHEKPIDRGFQVHNLEDGGVLVQYNCSDCPELVGNLERVVRGYPKFVILAPYPAMKHRIALTAWGKIDTLDAFDEARITGFINAFRGIDHHPRR